MRPPFACNGSTHTLFILRRAPFERGSLLQTTGIAALPTTHPLLVLSLRPSPTTLSNYANYSIEQTSNMTLKRIPRTKDQLFQKIILLGCQYYHPSLKVSLNASRRTIFIQSKSYPSLRIIINLRNSQGRHLCSL